MQYITEYKYFKIEIIDGDEDILATMADLLAKIFHDISEGKKESFPPLQKSVLPVPSSKPDDGLPSAESALQIFPVL